MKSLSATICAVATEQLGLPGFTPRGRPKSGLSKVERIRRSQAERRKKSENKSLSVEIDGRLLAAFKERAAGVCSLREAVEAALRGWMDATQKKPPQQDG